MFARFKQARLVGKMVTIEMIIYHYDTAVLLGKVSVSTDLGRQDF